MKVGNLNGTPEEIKDFIANQGLDINSLLNIPPPKPKIYWLIFSVLLFCVFVLIITVFENLSPNYFSLMVLGGFGSAIWMAACLQIRYNNLKLTLLVLFLTLILLLMATRAISLYEAFEYLKELQRKSK